MTLLSLINLIFVNWIIYSKSDLIKYQYMLNSILLGYVALHLILRFLYKSESTKGIKKLLLDFFICFDFVIVVFGVYVVYKSFDFDIHVEDMICFLLYDFFSLLFLVRFLMHVYIKKKKISEDSINTVSKLFLIYLETCSRYYQLHRTGP